ncbi:MAG: DUF2807 domain-containing protein [Cyclobacteriaceae bacterium]|nr:DUF2807 domain-containing protein [Cyclobacteriaceae bacterium]MCH8515036.1 DUF2807 domain-containing protein [Cyclobacteriaceae bacterium]
MRHLAFIPFLVVLMMMLIARMVAANPTIATADAEIVNNKKLTEERIIPLRNFQSLIVQGPFNIEITQDDRFSLVAVGESEVLDKVEYDLIDGRLTIKYPRTETGFLGINLMISKSKTAINLKIAMPLFEELNFSSAADAIVGAFEISNDAKIIMKGASSIDMSSLKSSAGLELSSTGASDLKGSIDVKHLSASASGASDLKLKYLSAEDATIKLSGASDMKAEVNGGNWNLNGGGASNFKLNGQVNFVQINLSGASSLKGNQFESADASIYCSGASDAKLRVSGTIDGKISGASDLKVSGTAAVNVQSSGASSIKVM